MAVFICCECDWDGVGAIPPHLHQELSLVKRTDQPDDEPLWIPGFLPQPGWDILETWDDISFSVDWKALYKELTCEAASDTK